MSEAKHTPTPWSQGPQGTDGWSTKSHVVDMGPPPYSPYAVCYGEDAEVNEANAAMIVAAVNAYAANEQQKSGEGGKRLPNITLREITEQIMHRANHSNHIRTALDLQRQMKLTDTETFGLMVIALADTLEATEEQYLDLMNRFPPEPLCVDGKCYVYVGWPWKEESTLTDKDNSVIEQLTQKMLHRTQGSIP